MLAFSPARFLQFLKLELYRNMRGILLVFEITFGFLFVMGFLLNVVFEYKKVVFEHNDNYTFTLLVGGYIVSSLAFKDLGSSLKRHSYLLLPVSALEKFVSMWLLTALGWTCLFTLAFYLYSLVANMIGGMLFPNITFQSFNPFGAHALTTVKYFLATQGIFMVGSAQFRGYVFPKTAAVLVGLGLTVFALFYLILFDVFLMDHVCVVPGHCELLDQSELGGWSILTWLFWWALPPLCWGLTYLGLKEQEA